MGGIMPRLGTRIALAVSTALVLSGQPASAQRIERMVVCDSYIDEAVEGGASLALDSALALEVQASATVEHPERNEFTGSLGLKFGF